jgi:Na+/melibiose symporter-like transporter
MSKLKKIKSMLPLEKMGLFLSFVCAVHCLSMPLLFFFAPYFIGSLAFSPRMEWFLVATSFGLAAFLLIQDFLKHRKPLPLYFLGSALLCKVVDILLSNQSIEWIFGLLLGIFVAIAYWVNYQHKSACTCKISS